VEVNTCPMLRQWLVALSLPLAPAQVTLPAPPPLLRPLSIYISTNPLQNGRYRGYLSAQASSTTSQSCHSLYTLDSVVVPHYHQPLACHA
ncbi:hypothetical protein V8C86DRAFT_2946438, partial [Haematococcus lacustris]